MILIFEKGKVELHNGKEQRLCLHIKKHEGGKQLQVNISALSFSKIIKGNIVGLIENIDCSTKTSIEARYTVTYSSRIDLFSPPI